MSEYYCTLDEREELHTQELGNGDLRKIKI